MQGQAFLDKAPEVANLQKQQKNLGAIPQVVRASSAILHFVQDDWKIVMLSEAKHRVQGFFVLQKPFMGWLLVKSIESLPSKTGKGVLGSLVMGIVVGGVAASGYNPFSSSSSSSGVQLAEGTGGSSATASFLNTLGRIMQTEIKR